MERVTVQMDSYRLAATVNFVTGDVSRTLDEGLFQIAPASPPAPPASDERRTPSEMAMFHFEVKVDGVPFPSLSEAASQDAAARHLALRFHWMSGELRRELEAAAEAMAEALLGRRGWMVREASVGSGSLTLTVVLLAAYAAIKDYGDVREGAIKLHEDLVRYALPFCRGALQRLFRAETVGAWMAPAAAQGAAPVPVPVPSPPIAAGEGAAQADGDVRTLLAELRGELKALRELRDELKAAAAPRGGPAGSPAGEPGGGAQPAPAAPPDDRGP